MNTDSLIHEEMGTQHARSVQQQSDLQGTAEKRTAEELIDTVAVNLSQKAFDETHSTIPTQFSEGSLNEYIQDHPDALISEETSLTAEIKDQMNGELNVVKRECSDVEDIPEAVLMEVVEEISGSVSDVREKQVLSGGITENKSGTEKNILDQVGQLTRNLHNSLRELGYDKRLESLAAEVPEAQDKLSYVAIKTEQAADRTLNATEIAMPIQEKLSSEAMQLSEKWKNAFEEQRAQPDTEKFKLLLIETLSYIDKVPERADATNAQLMEIMMAQDFQDLTGQVIKKITGVVQSLERDLLQLLLANVPFEKRQTQAIDRACLMNGPVTNPEKNTDTVSSQDQVDDLLASLGF